jgi:hypothetical protein
MKLGYGMELGLDFLTISTNDAPFDIQETAPRR